MEGESGLSALRLQGSHFVFEIIRSGVQRPWLEQGPQFKIFMNIDADGSLILLNSECKITSHLGDVGKGKAIIYLS